MKSRYQNTTKKKWPQIRERYHDSRTITFEVDLRIAGQGGRRFFKDRAEAETFAEQQRIKRFNEGARAITIMKANETSQAIQALEILEPYGIGILEAARYFAKQHSLARDSIALGDWLEDFYQAKRKEGAAKQSLRDIQSRVGRFVRDMGERTPLGEISLEQAQEWLDGLDVKPITRNNFKRELRMAANWAIDRRKIESNPFVKLKPGRIARQRVGIFSVEEIIRLLNAAEDESLPALVLGIFAGLRGDCELKRLRWTDIKWDRSVIDVHAGIAKYADRPRYVAMSENLVAWLKPLAKPAGPVVAGWDKRRRKIAKDANVTWQRNAARHSFCSYHLAMHQNITQLCEEAGHTAPAVTRKHYLNRVSKQDAQAFWSIVPDEKAGAKIVVMQA